MLCQCCEYSDNFLSAIINNYTSTIMICTLYTVYSVCVPYREIYMDQRSETYVPNNYDIAPITLGWIRSLYRKLYVMREPRPEVCRVVASGLNLSPYKWEERRIRASGKNVRTPIGHHVSSPQRKDEEKQAPCVSNTVRKKLFRI